MTFGQLWQGESVGAKKELNRIFEKGKPKVNVVDGPHYSDEVVKEKNCVVVALLRFHGFEVYASLDIGATPNVMSPQLVMHLR